MTSPAYGTSAKIMNDCLKFLKDWCLKVNLESDWQTDNHSFCLHNDDIRFEHLKTALSSIKAKAIHIFLNTV